MLPQCRSLRTPLGFLQGDAAIQHLLGEWASYWHDAKSNVTEAQAAAAAQSQLPRPTLDQVKQALKRFRHDVGLGVDGVNPRCWLLLGAPFLLRLIDVLLAWEQ
eukprot:2287287-Pyramimonas_sp.AAC.1